MAKKGGIFWSGDGDKPLNQALPNLASGKRIVKSTFLFHRNSLFVCRIASTQLIDSQQAVHE